MSESEAMSKGEGRAALALANLYARFTALSGRIRSKGAPHEAWCAAKGRCTYCDVADDIDDILEGREDSPTPK
jgi:ferredoxin